MGCGCIAQVLFLVFVALLIGSCQQIVTTLQYKEQVIQSGEEYHAKQPSGKWVKLTDVELDLSRHASRSISGEVLVPLRTNRNPDERVKILLSVKSPDETAMIRKLVDPNGDPTKTGAIMMELLDKLNRNNQVEGIVLHGVNEFASDKEEVMRAFPDLTDDFIIVQHDEKPGFGKAGILLASALLFFVLCVISQAIAEKLNGGEVKSPPLPPLDRSQDKF